MGTKVFYRFAKQGLGKFFFDNRYYRFVRTMKHYLLTDFAHPKQSELFRHVKTYCVFIGHMKSGGSMLSAMLDAHPRAVFSDEVNALEYIQFGFKKHQLFQILLRNSKAEAAKGRVTARRLGGYSWAVEGQWQGKYEVIEVFGDCTTGASTRSLGLNPRQMENLYTVMAGVNVKFIHVIRNPFDPIAASMVRGARSFESAAGNYFSSCDLLVELRKQIAPGDLLSVRYDKFVMDPKSQLASVCNFLGLKATDDYLEACRRVIHSSDESRNMVSWKQEWINSVQERITRYDFLHGYTF